VLYRISFVAAALVFSVSVAWSQQTSPGDSSSPVVRESVNNSQPQRESKRILGIIPNYRTSPSLLNYKPLTIREKFGIASEDAFDPGTVALAAIVAGQGQLTNGNRSFGQGAAGYSRYTGAAFGDLAIGDYMTEAVFPVLLHQYPRYFRRGTGSGWARLGYAMGQIFWTRRDSGGSQFNYSEVVGNSAAVAISQAYYANNRTAGEAASKLGLQIGADMVSNLLKEFWPELARTFTRKHTDTHK